MSFPKVQDELCTLPEKRVGNGYMVFEGITSVMNGSRVEEGGFNIPPRMRVKIVSLYTKEGQPMLDLQQKVIGDDIIELEFEPITPQDMRREIQKFIN